MQKYFCKPGNIIYKAMENSHSVWKCFNLMSELNVISEAKWNVILNYQTEAESSWFSFPKRFELDQIDEQNKTHIRLHIDTPRETS